MNKVILMGRLTRDPDIRYSQGENSRPIARYTLAVDRRRANADGQREAAPSVRSREHRWAEIHFPAL